MTEPARINQQGDRAGAGAPEILERLGALRNGLKRQVRAFTALDKSLALLARRCERLEKAPREVLEALSEVRGILLKHEPPEPPGALLDELEQQARAGLERARHRFGTELAAALKEKLGDRHELRALDAGYEYGTVRIVTDEAAGRVRLEYARIVVVKNLGTDPETVATAIKKLLDDLDSGDFDPEMFLRRSLAAYQRAVSEKGGRPGESVDILAFWGALVLEQQSDAFRREPTQKSFRDYPVHRFVHDLCKLRAARRFEIEGRRLDLETAVHDRAYGKSIWIPGERSGGSFYQGISFRQER